MPAMAKTDKNTIKLQAEMLRMISSTDRERFYEITEELKTVSQRNGDERLFYTAWGNEAIFEATHQYYTQAYDIVDKLTQDAKEKDSKFGQYMALHAKAMTDLQKQDYASAEESFKKAVDYRHQHFPGESAGDDLQELMKIANHRKDNKAGLKYANDILKEPDVLPIHKGRALFRLSQFAMQKNDREEYNRIYMELQKLKKSDGIAAIEPIVEVNYNIINGNYDEALKLCEGLSAEKKAERMGVIYHRMGDNDKAYEYMAKFKKINDSIVLVSHGNVVASCYVQMNNERMKLEQKLLEEQNARWKRLFAATLAIALIVILTMIIYQRQQKVKSLRNDNDRLYKDREKVREALNVKNELISAITKELREPLNPIEGFSDILSTKEYELQPEEREVMSQHIKDSSKVLTKIIDEMAELSFYESKKSLPMTTTISPNHVCRHMMDALKTRCNEEVTMTFETTLPDDVEYMINLEAMENLLNHLLENAIQYTQKGSIILKNEENGRFVRTSVTDTGSGIDPKLREHLFDMVKEEGTSNRLVGLGLPICKSIVTLLGGKIWLDTDYTEGSRFVFEIPKK